MYLVIELWQESGLTPWNLKQPFHRVDPTTILHPWKTIGKNIQLLAKKIPGGRSRKSHHPGTRQWIHTCRVSMHCWVVICRSWPDRYNLPWRYPGNVPGTYRSTAIENFNPPVTRCSPCRQPTSSIYTASLPIPACLQVRKGFEGLSGLVQNTLGCDPC